MTVEGGFLISKFLAGVGLVMGTAALLRGLGRFYNPAYRKFLGVLSQAQANYTEANKRLLEHYDFQFSAWPVDFDIRANQRSKSSEFLPKSPDKFSFKNSSLDLVSWLMTYSFGLSLVYPGSLSLMQMLIERQLLEGRTALLRDYKAARSKVVTMEGNSIDTIFVDRRNKSPTGNTLVICCEGNAGFYEVGMMSTPVKSEYSVLGWNHPGFYGSTGKPTPSQEANAADAVMQFALQKLGFLPEQILVYGWSIGGYTATWLGMNYPEIQGLILDATFDSLTPLAVPRMPAFLSPVVERAVANHINLDVLGQLVRYPGPVRIIRRSRDEVITTQEGELWSNRGNFLLKGFLASRHPSLMTPESEANLDGLLYRHGALTSTLQVLEEVALPLISKLHQDQEPEALSEEEKSILLTYLAAQTVTEFDNTHCNPLPSSKFIPPWDLNLTLQKLEIDEAEDSN